MVDFVGVVGSIATVVGVVGAVSVYLVRLVLKLDHKLDLIDAQQRPNGGSSLRDAVDRIDMNLDRVDSDLSRLSGAFEGHTKRL